ncbi:MAG: helix-turn-helix domain-containing protein [Clostridia bacterium]|nr:helix-turn-helix domain-containing protein [Clostridia bacterium]
MEFYQNLSALRKSKNLSQEEIADRLGVSRQAISKWENGQALPETANIMKLCEILEVTPNELLGYEEQKAKPVEQMPYDNEEIKEKKKWYKTTPFKVFVAVLGALLAINLIKLLIALGFAGVFMMRADVNDRVQLGEVVSVEAGEENISTGGVVKFSTQGTNGKKTIVRTEYVPDVYSSAYDCSFAFSGDGMQTVTEEAEFEGGMWIAEVELPKISGAIEVEFITDTGYKKVPVKIATIDGVDESGVSWH